MVSIGEYELGTLSRGSVTTADAVDLGELVTRLHGSRVDLDQFKVRSILGQTGRTLFVARTRKHQIVSMVLLIVEEGFTRTKARIDVVVTLDEHRNRELASELVRLAINRTNERGASVIELTSRPERDTERFYTRLGFEKADTNVYRMELAA